MLEEVSVLVLVLCSFLSCGQVRSGILAMALFSVFVLSLAELYLGLHTTPLGASQNCLFLWVLRFFSGTPGTTPVPSWCNPSISCQCVQQYLPGKDRSGRFPAVLGIRQPLSSPAGTSSTTLEWTTSRLSRSRERSAQLLLFDFLRALNHSSNRIRVGSSVVLSSKNHCPRYMF